jgi:sulfonate transport system substrate-binding protein
VVINVLERTDLGNPVIGDAQTKVITAAGDVLKQNNVISSMTDVNATIDDLIDPRYAQTAAGKNVAQK